MHCSCFLNFVAPLLCLVSLLFFQGPYYSVEIGFGIQKYFFFWPQPLSLQIKKECVLTENVASKIILELIFQLTKDFAQLQQPASVYFKFYAMLLLSVCSSCTIFFVYSYCTILLFVAQTTTSCIHIFEYLFVCSPSTFSEAKQFTNIDTGGVLQSTDGWIYVKRAPKRFSLRVQPASWN